MHIMWQMWGYSWQKGVWCLNTLDLDTFGTLQIQNAVVNTVYSLHLQIGILVLGQFYFSPPLSISYSLARNWSHLKLPEKTGIRKVNWRFKRTHRANAIPTFTPMSPQN
jgi:hypothetical protein